MKRLIPTLALTVILVGCGASDLIRGFRIGFSASKPAIQALVPNTISQAKATIVIRDVDSGISAAERGELCIKSITETGPQKRVAQARCYVTLASDLRAMLDQHGIGGNPVLDQIRSLVEAAIAAFEEFNRAVGPNLRAASLPSEESGKVAEKQLEQKLKDVETRLKALGK